MEDALLESALLFLVADRKPVLDQDDAAAHQHSFEFRAGAEELAVLLFSAEAHDALDAGPVVPAAVEEDHLAAGRKVLHVTLEIPLRRFPVGRRRQCRDARDARAQTLGDALDAASLAGGVAAFEDHHDLEFLELDPLLQLDELDLQLGERFFVVLGVHSRLAYRRDLAEADGWRRCRSGLDSGFRLARLGALLLRRLCLDFLGVGLGCACRGLAGGLDRRRRGGLCRFLAAALARGRALCTAHRFFVAGFQFTH